MDEPAATDVHAARVYLADLSDRRAVQVHRFLAGLNKRPRREIEGQLAIDTPRPEVCPNCAEVVCDAGCELATLMDWPTEATRVSA